MAKRKIKVGDTVRINKNAASNVGDLAVLKSKAKGLATVKFYDGRSKEFPVNQLNYAITRHRVFEVVLPDGDHPFMFDLGSAKDFIEMDLDNVQHLEEVEYTIRIKYMTDNQIEKAGEYNG